MILLFGLPLPITDLSYLLRLNTADILRALEGLQSVILIPKSDNEPIQFFHSSLRDFLISQPQSGAFFINPPNGHLYLTIDCLTAMATEPKNVVNEGAQEYACLNWCEHFHQGLSAGQEDIPFSSLLEAALETFMSNSLGYCV